MSVCDSVNYVTDEEELQEVFCLVNNYLDPQGIFIFDFNTEYKYRKYWEIGHWRKSGRNAVSSG